MRFTSNIIRTAMLPHRRLTAIHVYTECYQITDHWSQLKTLSATCVENTMSDTINYSSWMENNTATRTMPSQHYSGGEYNSQNMMSTEYDIWLISDGHHWPCSALYHVDDELQSLLVDELLGKGAVFGQVCEQAQGKTFLFHGAVLQSVQYLFSCLCLK